MDPLEGTLYGRLSTDLTSEFTHFNPGIRVRKGKPSAFFHVSQLCPYSHSFLRCHLHHLLHATISWLRDTSSIHYNFSQITFFHATTIHVTNPQRLSCSPMRDPSYMRHWKPDVGFHDTGKANGIDFPATVRSSKFSQYKDIEGMDPL